MWWLPSSFTSVTLHSMLTGDSSMTGAKASLDAFPAVRCISFHLSVSLPDLTPHQSAARSSFSVVRLMTNSPLSRMMS